MQMGSRYIKKGIMDIVARQHPTLPDYEVKVLIVRKMEQNNDPYFCRVFICKK